MGFYRKRVPEIEARQYASISDCHDLAEWCGGKIVTARFENAPGDTRGNMRCVEINPPEIVIRIPNFGVRIAKLGDYIVLAGNGCFLNHGKEEFERRYEEVG